MNQTPEQIRSRRKHILAVLICNVLEFFDFVAYSFFFVQIGRAFFPEADAQSSLLYSAAVFAVGFIARPVGSIVIGAYADRKGRKPALLATAVLMLCGTLGIAVTPAYAAIGIAAPVCVTVCRLVQGFAFGGEFGPSSAFLLEIARPASRAFAISLQFVAQGAAAVLAGAMGWGLSVLLSPADMAAWGWRLPFFFGALLVPVALYLRMLLPETLDAAAPVPGGGGKAPRPGLYIVPGIAVIAGGSVATYVGNYMATYATTVLKLPASAAALATLTVGLATIAGALAGGWLADRLGRWPLMFWPRLVGAALTVPAFHLLGAYPGIPGFLAVAAVLAFLTAANGSGALTAICELYPQARRARALSFIYSAGVALFGGTTQFVITWLTRETGSPIAPAWYVVFTSALALLATIFLPETGSRRPITPANNLPLSRANNC